MSRAQSGVALVVLLASGLVGSLMSGGCPKSGGGLVGRWEAEEASAQAIEFRADGRVTVRDQFGNVSDSWYRVEGDRLTVGRLYGWPEDDTHGFTLKGDRLVLGGFLTGTYRRVT